MIDFSKTFCDLHPNDLVANFCCKEQCFVGLCATCICSHTQSHMQRKTTPEYQNIRTTYSKMQDNIRACIQSFEHERKRVNNIADVIKCKRKQLEETVEQARKESIDFVNKFFDFKLKDFLRKIEAEEKKVGLHSENRMDSLLNLITRDLNTLFSAAQELNSQNFLESYQRIKMQVLGNSLETQKEISKQLDRNEGYETSIIINPMYINQLRDGLERAITLTFCETKLVSQRDSKVEQRNNSRVRYQNTQSSIITGNQLRYLPDSYQIRQQPQQLSQTMQLSNPIRMSNSSQGYLAATYGVPMYNLANSYQRASCEIANDNLKSQVQVRYPSGYQTCSIGMQQIINGQTELRSSSTENTRKENKSPRKQVYTVFNENNKYSSSSNELKKVRRSGLQLSKN